MTQSRAPLIVAIALLILPMLYVGSYLALVTPQARLAFYNAPPPAVSFGYLTHYRCGGDWARSMGLVAKSSQPAARHC